MEIPSNIPVNLGKKSFLSIFKISFFFCFVLHPLLFLNSFFKINKFNCLHYQQIIFQKIFELNKLIKLLNLIICKLSNCRLRSFCFLSNRKFRENVNERMGREGAKFRLTSEIAMNILCILGCFDFFFF